MDSVDKKLAVLASGSGSNLAAIIGAVNSGLITGAEIAIVVSNKKDAFALKRAENAGIDTLYVQRSKFETDDRYDEYLVGKLQEKKVDVVLLAGYLRILTRPLLDAYKDKILNIHPSLLPAFGGIGMYGMKVHEAAIKAGVVNSGCSVHIVNEQVDGGPILGQAVVEVTPDDTPQSLASRVLKEEHKLFPAVVHQFLSNMD